MDANSLASELKATRFVDDLELHSTLSDEPAAEGRFPDVPGFEILAVLGEGGMGIVYKARNLALKRLVALKMIAPEHVGPNTCRRFQREAETVARLQHPNVVQIYDVGELEGRPFLALELIEGGTLAQRLEATGPLPARDAALMVAAIARAVHYAHERGVVHRDLKPGNILLQTDESGTWQRETTADELADKPGMPMLGTPKVSDFGLARLLDVGQEHTRTGAILGTPAYMAPEQAAGRGDLVGPATDIYSLGSLLFEVLTGQPPFVGESSWDVLVQIIHADPPAPSRVRPKLARDLDTICLKALAKQPANRYATAAAMADDLERFAAGEAISARPESMLSLLARRIRRQPIRVAALLLAAGMLIGGLLLSAFVRSETSRGLHEGREFVAKRRYDEAVVRYEQAMRLARRWPVAGDLQQELNAEWRHARRQQIAAELHALAERLRFCHDLEGLSAAQQSSLAVQSHRVWDARNEIMAFGDSDRDSGWDAVIRANLLDVILLGSNLEIRLADPARSSEAREQALLTIAEIEKQFGPTLAAALQRQQHERALGRPTTPIPDALAPRTAWDYYTVGRARLLAAGTDHDLAAAEQAFENALRADRKQAVFYFWAGRAAFLRGNYDVADKYFTVCIAGQSPASLDACYYNRGLALLHKGKLDAARSDFDAAIALQPGLAHAWLNRGIVFFRQNRVESAISDMREALNQGADAALVHYNLATVYAAQRQNASAREHLAQALTSRPNFPEALQLQKRLGNY